MCYFGAIALWARPVLLLLGIPMRLPLTKVELDLLMLWACHALNALPRPSQRDAPLGPTPPLVAIVTGSRDNITKPCEFEGEALSSAESNKLWSSATVSGETTAVSLRSISPAVIVSDVVDLYSAVITRCPAHPLLAQASTHNHTFHE